MRQFLTLILFSSLLIMACDDSELTPDDENDTNANFLSGSALEDLVDNPDFEIFIYGIQQADKYPSPANGADSVTKILKGDNPIFGSELTVFVPTDSSLQALHDDVISSYNSEDWYNYIRAHILPSSFSFTENTDLDLIENTVKYLGEGEISNTNQNQDYYAQGKAFSNLEDDYPDALIQPNGENFIESDFTIIHVIDGDFVNKLIPHSPIYGTWLISEVNVLDEALNNVSVTFNSTNRTFNVTNLQGFTDANLNHSEFLASEGSYSMSISNDEIIFNPGGTAAVEIISDEIFTLSYFAPFPKGTDDDIEIILTFNKE